MPNNRFRTTQRERINKAQDTKSTPTRELFVADLTDDGADANFSEDYSTTNASASFTFTGVGGVVCGLFITMLDGAIPQSTLLNHERWLSNISLLTNGIQIRVEDASGAIKLDITNTVPVTRIMNLDVLLQYVEETFNTSDTTAGNNYHTYEGVMHFESLFGKSIQMDRGDKFVVRLRDDFTTQDLFTMQIWGYYAN